jgi:8-oxo-dGTP pyrophosphatase MutT (NUDIX family)
MLDLEADRAATPPKDAATLLLLRDGSEGPEVFCVERNKASRFMGGALVFPGGKVDSHDAADAFLPHVRGLPAVRESFAESESHLRAIAVAALRESLEEAALLPVAVESAAPDHERLLSVRAELAADATAFAALLAREKWVLDLASLRPFARWVTPVAEARRYDTRFFVCRAPEGQPGAHDDGETTASFWATPARVLERFASGEVRLAPPTHRSLELLLGLGSVDAVFALADTCSLQPICPVLVQQPERDDEPEGAKTMALVLPGDPSHPVRDVLVPGASRYVLRAGKFVPEQAPKHA